MSLLKDAGTPEAVVMDCLERALDLAQGLGLSSGGLVFLGDQDRLVLVLGPPAC